MLLVLFGRGVGWARVVSGGGGPIRWLGKSWQTKALGGRGNESACNQRAHFLSSDFRLLASFVMTLPSTTENGKHENIATLRTKATLIPTKWMRRPSSRYSFWLMLDQMHQLSFFLFSSLSLF
jgi:hypothetical protein